MEKNTPITKNNAITQNIDGLVVLDKQRKNIDWDKVKIGYFLSPHRQVRTFLIEEGYFNKNTVLGGSVRKATRSWELEKKDWELQALEVTMHNLKEHKAIEMKGFIEEEGKVVKQLINMTKVAMNNLLVKRKNAKTGKDEIALTNTGGFKQVTEATLTILKYGRDRLGIAFDNEDAGITNALNFNFDLINLDEVNPESIKKLFKNKDEQQRNTKPIKTDAISAISQNVRP